MKIPLLAQDQRIRSWAITAAIAVLTSVLCWGAVVLWQPDNNYPQPQDPTARSLQKINSILKVWEQAGYPVGATFTGSVVTDTNVASWGAGRTLITSAAGGGMPIHNTDPSTTNLASAFVGKKTVVTPFITNGVVAAGSVLSTLFALDIGNPSAALRGIHVAALGNYTPDFWIHIFRTTIARQDLNTNPWTLPLADAVNEIKLIHVLGTSLHANGTATQTGTIEIGQCIPLEPSAGTVLYAQLEAGAAFTPTATNGLQLTFGLEKVAQ